MNTIYHKNYNTLMFVVHVDINFRLKLALTKNSYLSVIETFLCTIDRDVN